MPKRKAPPPAKRKAARARAMPNLPPAMLGAPPAPGGMAGPPGMKKGGVVKGKKKK